MAAINNTEVKMEETSKPPEAAPEPQIIPGQVPEGFTSQKEGKATILIPQKSEAFYNPAQVVNRDLSVACLKQFAKKRREEVVDGKLKPHMFKNGAPRCLDPAIVAERRASDPEQIRILEGLAASGLRAIRYALEVDGVSRIDANDIDPKSAQAIRRSVAFNAGLAADRVSTTQSDARVLMIQRAGAYDAVDLDPYGSPCQLMDSAVQAVSEGGMLMVTATDMAVLCGNHGEACWSKYGSYPLHRPYCHEQALRILLASIQSHAARHKRIIVPMLSLSIDFYVRVFVRVYTSPKDVKDSATKLTYIYQSSNCDSFYCQPVGRKEERNNQPRHMPGRGPCVPERCPETGSNFIVGGPFWSAPIHDTAFVQGVLQEIEDGEYQAQAKLRSLLTLALEELADVPLYYNLHDLAKLLKTQAPPQDTFRSALVNAGYRVSSTHANPLAVKTDAPPAVVWDVMRAWVKKQGKEKQYVEGSAAEAIMGKEITLTVDFSRAKGAASKSKLGKITRFPVNPEPNWGPMRKHTRQEGPEDAQPKKRMKQAGKMSGLEDDDMFAATAAPQLATAAPQPATAEPQPEELAK